MFRLAPALRLLAIPVLVLPGACAEPEALIERQDHPTQTADIGLTGRIHFNSQTGPDAVFLPQVNLADVERSNEMVWAFELKRVDESRGIPRVDEVQLDHVVTPVCGSYWTCDSQCQRQDSACHESHLAITQNRRRS